MTVSLSVSAHRCGLWRCWQSAQRVLGAKRSQRAVSSLTRGTLTMPKIGLGVKTDEVRHSDVVAVPEVVGLVGLLRGHAEVCEGDGGSAFVRNNTRG